MPTNQEIWGQSSDWTCPVSGMTGSNNNMKPLVGYFGEAPSSLYPAGCLFSGIYHDIFPTINGNMFTDEPIDNSISYCGLGNESVWSRVQYYMVGPTTAQSLTASDNRSITNFAFCYSQGTASGLFQNNNSETNKKRGNRDRWAPMGYNLKELNPAAMNTNSNRGVVPYVQLPIRNMVLTATLRVAKQLTEDKGSTAGMDIVNIPLWDYMDTNKTKNYTTHPYILAITIQPYALSTDKADDIDPITGAPPAPLYRATRNIYSGITLLSPLSYAKGVESDAGNPGNVLGDVYSYYWSKCSRMTGVWIFGSSTTNMNDTDYIRQLSTDEITGQLRWTLPHPYATMRTMEQTNDYGWYYLEYYDNGEDDNLVHWIMEQMACFGLFFTIDEETAMYGALNDENMCLGVLENGVGHGKWVSGEDNMEQEQWEWDTTNSSSYKPKPDGGGGDRPKPEPGANAKGLHTPGFSLAVNNGSVSYIINQGEWGQIWSDIYGGSKNDWKELIDGLALYGSNPLNAILNYRWYPFEFAAGTAEQLRLGASLVGPATHKYNVITAASQGFKSKTASFWCGEYAGFEKNFVNIRRTKCRVWLPFYGFYELPMTMVINHTVNITFQYSIPDDMGIWEIAFGGSMWDYVECQPFVEIPITGDNSLQIAAAKAQRNLSIAMTIVGAVAGAAIIGAGAGVAPSIGAIKTAAVETASITGGSMLSAAAANIAPLAGEGLLNGLKGAAGSTTALVGGGIKIANTVMQSALQVGNLSTNLPTHSAASDTTFLNLPLSPFIEFYIPIMQDDYDESGYKETTGMACDKWVSLNDLGNKLDTSSLLKTGGIADMDISGMELEEIIELNSIVQNGFWL